MTPIKFIKNVDPTAQVAISGLVEVTPGRLQYLDIVWNTYMQEFGTPMPVDMWTMHLYILPEVQLQPDGSIDANGIANVALGTNKALGKRESNGTAASLFRSGCVLLCGNMMTSMSLPNRWWQCGNGWPNTDKDKNRFCSRSIQYFIHILLMMEKPVFYKTKMANALPQTASTIS